MFKCPTFFFSHIIPRYDVVYLVLLPVVSINVICTPRVICPSDVICASRDIITNQAIRLSDQFVGFIVFIGFVGLLPAISFPETHIPAANSMNPKNSTNSINPSTSNPSILQPSNPVPSCRPNKSLLFRKRLFFVPK